MANIKKMVCYSTPCFTCVDVTFMNSKSLKPKAEPMYCFPQHLYDLKYIAFLEVHFKMAVTLYLRLVAKQVNSVEATKKLVQMSHLFWHFSEELECRL